MTAAFDEYWTPRRDATRSSRSSTTSPTGTSAARAGASTRSTRRRSGRSGTRSSRALRVVAPLMPFLADELWRNLVAGACEGAPDSVHLAGWPEAAEADAALLAEIAELREVVELGRQARAEAGVKLRQPLRRVRVYGSAAADGHFDEITDELRVKEVELLDEAPLRFSYKPNLRVLGPRLGGDLPAVRSALESGDFEELGDGRLRVAGPRARPGRPARRARAGARLGALRPHLGRVRPRARRRARARGPRLRPRPRGRTCCARSAASRSPTGSS